MKRLIGVAVLVSAMAGCGAGDLDTTDGSAWGAFSGNLPTIEDAPRIEVVTAPEPGGSRSHEALTDDEEPATHDAVSEHNEEHDESPDAEVDGTDETSPAADDPTAHHDPTADEETASDHAPASGDEGAESDHDEGVEADQPETADDDGYVVEVTMLEFGYELDRETVPVGEPVTFRFVNDGQIEHEAMFGSAHQQEEFADSDDHGDHGSEGHHGEIAAITLDAAAAGEMVMVFDSPGEVMIGCHLPGHWDAGMATSFQVLDT